MEPGAVIANTRGVYVFKEDHAVFCCKKDITATSEYRQKAAELFQDFAKKLSDIAGEEIIVTTVLVTRRGHLSVYYNPSTDLTATAAALQAAGDMAADADTTVNTESVN